ncbi:hypothetical protein B0H11DRAFT_2187494 [Mycena galericulata]|nr:hypothetical protein B0H11DRAFT_2187494 [Mycena galericulata]
MPFGAATCAGTYGGAAHATAAVAMVDAGAVAPSSNSGAQLSSEDCWPTTGARVASAMQTWAQRMHERWANPGPVDGDIRSALRRQQRCCERPAKGGCLQATRSVDEFIVITTNYTGPQPWSSHYYPVRRRRRNQQFTCMHTGCMQRRSACKLWQRAWPPRTRPSMSAGSYICVSPGMKFTMNVDEEKLNLLFEAAVRAKLEFESLIGAKSRHFRDSNSGS